MTDWQPSWGSRTYVMAVANATPDSFSGDGIVGRPDLLEHLTNLAMDGGADLLDIGGESTRPNAIPVTEEVELARTIPAIELSVRAGRLPISVDTCKAVVARRALAAGASMVNDVSGLQDPRMAAVVADSGGWLVLGHHGPAGEGPEGMSRVISGLRKGILRAEAAGVETSRILVDPGLGFGKTWRENLALIRNLRELAVLEKPIVVGPSRKGMIGQVLGLGVNDRVEGTIALSCLCIANGADVIRVHDVLQLSRAARMMDAIVRT